jgi:NADH-quinone oxidoreductase subunit N
VAQLDLIALMPFLVITGGAVLAMLAIAIRRNHRFTFAVTLASFALGFASLSLQVYRPPQQLTALLVMDSYARFYLGLLFAAGFAVTLMAHTYLERQSGNREEFYFLLLVATLGSAVLVSSTHFASFLLGLEILSVSLYVLIGYPRTTERSTEAAVKYLILAAVSAAFLFFGMALIYADLGTMELPRMSALLAARTGAPSTLLLTGLALTIIGIGFKLAVVPFHMWTPDIYEGAPAPAAAFVASASKGGMFALLLRYFSQLRMGGHGSFFVIFTAIAIASMLAGNLLALRQNNIKRILAYSSIANWGYLLVAFLATGPQAFTATAYYMAAYFAAILCAFGVVSAISRPEEEADDIADYLGLYWRRPWLAGIFTTALLSLASIPLTAGFVAKFYVMAAGIDSALWLLVLVLVGSSGIGLYYYLRVVVTMSQGRGSAAAARLPALSLTGGLVLAALAVTLIWLGVYPSPIVRLIAATAAEIR